MSETPKITIEWSPVDCDWAASVPAVGGTCMAHGRTPMLALQKALRMAGANAHQKLHTRESER
jgi:hypothetical protein